MILDIGRWDSKETERKTLVMFIQAQLIRRGHYTVGKVDGIAGPRTLNELWVATGSQSFGSENIAKLCR